MNKVTYWFRIAGKSEWQKSTATSFAQAERSARLLEQNNGSKVLEIFTTVDPQQPMYAYDYNYFTWQRDFDGNVYLLRFDANGDVEDSFTLEGFIEDGMVDYNAVKVN